MGMSTQELLCRLCYGFLVRDYNGVLKTRGLGVLITYMGVAYRNPYITPSFYPILSLSYH